MYKITRRSFLGMTAVSIAASCAPKSLSMAAGNGTKEQLRIAFITDLHLHNAPHVAAALEMIRRQVTAAKVDIILGGGDWMHRGMRSTASEAAPIFKDALALLRSFQTDFVAIPGNHDHVDVYKQPRDTLLDPYFTVFPRADYRSIRQVGSYTLMMLPTLNFTGEGTYPYRGEVLAEDLKWLNAELAKIPRERPIILLQHVPMFTLLFQRIEGAAAPAPTSKVVTNNQAVLEAFREHNLFLVLQGHLHVNEFLQWGKTTFITGGALCGRWWEGPNYGTEPGFGIVTLSAQGIDWDYRPYGFRPGKA